MKLERLGTRWYKILPFEPGKNSVPFNPVTFNLNISIPPKDHVLSSIMDFVHSQWEVYIFASEGTMIRVVAPYSKSILLVGRAGDIPLFFINNSICLNLK